MGPPRTNGAAALVRSASTDSRSAGPRPGYSVMIFAPSGVSTTSSSIRAAEMPSVAGQYVSTANTMPTLSSIGSRNDVTREINGRSCKPSPKPWQKFRPNASISLAKPISSAVGSACATSSLPMPGFKQLDRAVHPLARLAVRRALRRRRATDRERAVVARAVADERMDDVEERLVAGADQAVREVVRMRRAALAGDRVDRPRRSPSPSRTRRPAASATISDSLMPGFSASAMSW